MNILVLIYDGPDECKLKECVDTFIKNANSQSQIWLYSRTEFNLPVKHFLLSNSWDGRRMTHRMELIRDLPAKIGDCIISCDIDVKFQGDPFQVFATEFDLFYTSREYKCESSVNAGVWGIRKTADSDCILKFMISEAIEPSWCPYLEIRKRLNRVDRNLEIDWWTNQDLLCAIHEAGLSFGSIFDAGAVYNCCPETGPNLPLTADVISKFKSKIGNPNYIIIHYKELKGKL